MTGLVSTSALPTVAATIVVAFGVAVVYLYIGYRLYQRPVSSESRVATAQFSIWWGGLGANVGIQAIALALAVANALPFALALTLGLLLVAIDCAFLWGLVGFLIYVYTGRYHLFELTLFYSGFYVLALYYTLSQVPYAVAVQNGVATLLYSVSPNVGLEAVALLGILVPEVVGAVLYLSLLRRTRDPNARFRIGLVGTAILLWFAIDAVFPASSNALILTKTVLEVIPGLMSLIAFFPPDSARRRFGAPPPKELSLTTGERPVPP
ncbi:MAG: hypothetical protein L3J68_02390 [Thermoplasmata archaeon]|nr:hypothetical protein [Thermoplasmata archaeon]